jgi:hypothetical protein
MNAVSNNLNRWEALLDALMAFDEHAKPVGLYAPEEFNPTTPPAPRAKIEWEQIYAPTLKAAGCFVKRPRVREFSDGRYSFVTRARQDGHLQVVRLSKIKVRKYGNAYRVDPWRKFPERWLEAGMERKVSALDQQRYHSMQCKDCHLLLFVGFSAEEEPFAEELAHLEQETAWPKWTTRFSQRIWPDPHNRKFNTIAALWTYEPIS